MCTCDEQQKKNVNGKISFVFKFSNGGEQEKYIIFKEFVLPLCMAKNTFREVSRQC